MIISLLHSQRDIFELYDVDEMRNALRDLLNAAVGQEEYELADLINQYWVRLEKCSIS